MIAGRGGCGDEHGEVARRPRGRVGRPAARRGRADRMGRVAVVGSAGRGAAVGVGAEPRRPTPSGRRAGSHPTGAPHPVPAAMRVIRQPPLLDRRAQVGSFVPSRVRRSSASPTRAARALAAYLSGQGRTVALMHSFEADAARTESWRRPRRAAASSWAGVSPRSRRCPICGPRSSSTTPTRRCRRNARRRGTRATSCRSACRAGVGFVVCSPAPTVEALIAAGEARPVEAPRPTSKRPVPM